MSYRLRIPSCHRTSRSPLELHEEAEGTAVVQGVGNLPEIRIGQIEARLGKLWSIEKVDGFGAKDQPLMTVEAPGSRERRVHVVNAPLAEDIASQISPLIGGVHVGKGRARQKKPRGIRITDGPAEDGWV